MHHAVIGGSGLSAPVLQAYIVMVTWTILYILDTLLLCDRMILQTW